MPEQTSLEGAWMNEVTQKTDTLKVLDGQSIKLVSKNNGVKKESVDYGTSVAFLVRVDNEQSDKTFYVKANNFDLLGQFKEIATKHNGSIVGVHLEISRKGSKKSDTRYTIKEI